MNTLLAVSSFVLALISVVTVISMIKQNNRMLEASSRPYISVYFDYVNMGEPIGYFVIKNFGNSSAKITSISYNEVVKKQPTTLCKVTDILDGLVGNSIAPGQKFLLPVRLFETPDGTCEFNIKYSSNTKPYHEKFEIITSQFGKLSKSRIKNDNSDKLISYPLQEIAERLM